MQGVMQEHHLPSAPRRRATSPPDREFSTWWNMVGVVSRGREMCGENEGVVALSGREGQSEAAVYLAEINLCRNFDSY